MEPSGFMVCVERDVSRREMLWSSAKLAFEEQFEQSRERTAGTDPQFRNLSVQQKSMQGGEVVGGSKVMMG